MSVSSVSGNPYDALSSRSASDAEASLLSSFPFKKGVPLNIFVNGTIGNTVTAGKFNLDVKFSGIA